MLSQLGERAAATLVGLAAALVLAVPAGAEPYSPTDRQYLAALQHGGLCCPSQLDTPIRYPSAELAIKAGRGLAAQMAANPMYAKFHQLRSHVHNTVNLNSFDSGQLVIIAVHYYAAPRSNAS